MGKGEWGTGHWEVSETRRQCYRNSPFTLCPYSPNFLTLLLGRLLLFS